jgi:hypothetical protein
VKNRSLLAKDFKRGQLPRTTTPSFATIRQDGAQRSGTAIASSEASTTGRYTVTFNPDISRCTAAVTPGTNQAITDGNFNTGAVYYARMGYRWVPGGVVRDPHSVAVEFTAAVAEGRDVIRTHSGFHIVVFC